MNENSVCLSSLTKGIRVIWGITSKCNLRCKHCASEFRENMISHKVSEYFKVLMEMKKANVDTVYLSGGEPLLYNDIYEIIRNGKRLGLKITLGTNGTLLNEKAVKKLREVNIDKVFVSLDHWKKEKHDWLRGRKGSFARVVDGIKLLKKYQIKTRIDTLVWKENYMHLEKMVDFCKKLGVDEIIFAWPVKIGKAAKNYSYIFPPSKEYLRIGEKLERMRRNETKIKILFHRFKYFNASCKDCFGGKKIFYVDPSGRLGPCFWISTILNFFTEKTVFSEKFSNLMKDDVIMNFRKMIKKRYLQFGPGCPFICLIENGNLYSKDPLFINCCK